jgi:hypothetical protein
MKLAKQQEACQLRAEGCSIKEIARSLRVSTSSVSIWVRNIRVSEEHLNGLIQRVRQNGADVGRARAAGYRALDQKEQEEGYHRAASDSGFWLICGMYWGEGSKKNHLFQISNSDPRFLAVICSWLNAVGVKPSAATFRVQYYTANGLSEQEIVEHWVTEIPYLKECVLWKCRGVIAKKPSQIKLIGKCPYGTCAVYVRRSRRLFNLVMGGIEYLSATFRGD